MEKTFNCKKCGKEATSKFPAKQYCSDKCRDTLYFKNCSICGGFFFKVKTKSVLNWEERKFCSPGCTALGRRVEKVTKFCQLCKEPFLARAKDPKKYCGRRCGRALKVLIPDEELFEAAKLKGGRAALSRKYGVDPATITRRIQKLFRA